MSRQSIPYMVRPAVIANGLDPKEYRLIRKTPYTLHLEHKRTGREIWVRW